MNEIIKHLHDSGVHDVKLMEGLDNLIRFRFGGRDFEIPYESGMTVEQFDSAWKEEIKFNDLLKESEDFNREEGIRVIPDEK